MTIDTYVARSAMHRVIDALRERFFERDAVIEGMAAALIAQEHILLLGPPGGAKSEIASAFCGALGGKFFSTLCTRFQPPEEVLGQLSLRELQEDRYVRRTTNRLPEADVVLLDEVFKGSSALLNTLLRVLNERTFEQDGVLTRIPLRLCVAASNELPDESDGLGAFHDRFLLRFQVNRLAYDESVRGMLFSSREYGEIPYLPMEYLDVLSEAAKEVVISKDAEDACLKIRDSLHEKNVFVSDRRWKKAVKLLRAKAVLLGGERVTSANLTILENCLWEKTSQIQTVREVVRANVASWIRATQEAHAALDEQSSRVRDAGKTGGRKSDAISQLARVLDSIAEINSTMGELVSSAPEAVHEVDAITKRIVGIKAEINSAMRVHGVGV